MFNPYPAPPPEATFWKDVPRVFAVFVKNKQNARGRPTKTGKNGKIEHVTAFVKKKRPKR